MHFWQCYRDKEDCIVLCVIMEHQLNKYSTEIMLKIMFKLKSIKKSKSWILQT